MLFHKLFRGLLCGGKLTCLSFQIWAQSAESKALPIHPLRFSDVRVEDSFWSPKFKIWSSKTTFDVFDKLEGKHEPEPPDVIAGKEKLPPARNAFQNFDWVAEGKKNTQTHLGLPWYDGLAYETIRGASDLLSEYPNKALENKIDGYIERIIAAQNADPDSYINTYTTLICPARRWGANGGNDRWQHDLYNAGMLMEAGVHYYRATGKIKLLHAAVKMSHYICKEMGQLPKKNVIPGHGGPEEALLKVYQLFKEQPRLKSKMSVPVNENDYLAMVKFWIEARGNYGEKDGSHARKSDSSYNQDHEPVFQQQTIEGHAVRATLLATGITATAIETGDRRYRQTAGRYWNNMAGKRMFITGGQGAVAKDERFGEDYFLPESAYLETCAAIGAGFFSEKMNELEANGKYMDEFERVIYNNFLSGISLGGDHYFYENPLIGNGNKRWAWHGCPCCPPMILKLAGAIPQYIYAYDEQHLYVNLFIGSEATFKIGGTEARLKQETNYPWQGLTTIRVTPTRTAKFSICVRIPGWAEGKENPSDLYYSKVKGKVSLKVNAAPVAASSKNGYVSITRAWKKGDVIELNLPMEPRRVVAHDFAEALKNKVAIASGPVIYSLEELDNPGLKDYVLNAKTAFKVQYQQGQLGGINVIDGEAADASGKQVIFRAIPFYALGNRQPGSPYKTWIQVSHK